MERVVGIILKKAEDENIEEKGNLKDGEGAGEVVAPLEGEEATKSAGGHADDVGPKGKAIGVGLMTEGIRDEP